MRTAVVVIGAVLIVVGGILLVVGFASFAAEANTAICNNGFPQVGCPYSCSGPNCTNITYAIQQGELQNQQTFQQETSAFLGAWVSLALGAVVGVVGVIVLIVGFVLESPGRHSTTQAPGVTFSQSITCSACGMTYTLNPEDKFCRNCGAALR